jgi:hypothetical protein
MTPRSDVSLALGSHPRCQSINFKEMCSAHPKVGKAVPAVYRRGKNVSIFLHPDNPYGYADSMIGKDTVEFSPSNNSGINSQLEAICGTEVTLYVYLGYAGGCRKARVYVEKHPQTHKYLLHLLP